MKIFNYSKQKINKADIVSVTKTLRFQNLSRGPSVLKFEKKLQKFTGSKFTIAVNSGTSALIGAIKSLELEKNSTIIVPNITFVATANSVLLSGHKVELVDVSEKTGLVTPEELEKKIKNKKISCFINVHLNGNIENISKIYKICKKNNIKIIDDACHALGTKYKYKNEIFLMGNNKFSDISTLSFHPTKLITTGEGGAIVTNNKKYFDRIKKIINHGYEPFKIKKNNYFHDYYKITAPGYNFRISDINCALGLSQLSKFRSKINHRRKIAKFYDNYFKDNKSIGILKISPSVRCAYHLYPIFIKNYKKINKIKFINLLKKKNIITQIHYLPLSFQPLFKKNKNIYKNSEKYYQSALSIPIHDGISLKDANIIANIICKELKNLNGN